jgi:hypothetical protein
VIGNEQAVREIRAAMEARSGAFREWRETPWWKFFKRQRLLEEYRIANAECKSVESYWAGIRARARKS